MNSPNLTQHEHPSCMSFVHYVVLIDKNVNRLKSKFELWEETSKINIYFKYFGHDAQGNINQYH